MQETIEPEPGYDLQPDSSAPTPQETRQQRQIMIAVIVAAVVLIAFSAAIVYFLLQPGTDTAKIRDVFIIFMALESIILMVTMIIMIFQMSILINLLQNEVKPILESTNETVSNLRGTTKFLSDNLSEPVIKLNEYLAGFSQLFHLAGGIRPGKNKKSNKNEGV
jgi:hypothetical protein